MIFPESLACGTRRRMDGLDCGSRAPAAGELGAGRRVAGAGSGCTGVGTLQPRSYTRGMSKRPNKQQPEYKVPPNERGRLMAQRRD